MAQNRQSKQSADAPRAQPLLRRADQAVVATLIVLALVGMAVYWFILGGPYGELIEIDRAKPLTARYLVDINQAPWFELAELPDLGETLARRIVESRNTAGPFKDHNDLRRVRGIGPLTLQKMQPYLLPLPDQEDVASQPKTNSTSL